MRRIVIDANVIIAAAIKNETTREILFNNDWQLLVPEHIFSELVKHKVLIKEKADYSDDEFETFLIRILSVLKPVSFLEFYDCIPFAEQICPDPDDVMYFALAMKLNCPLWSNEKRLKNQKYIRIYSTQELLGLLK